MRLFVALEVPEAVRREVERRLAAVRTNLPPAHWVSPEAIHLTLVFLGEIEPARLDPLTAALEQAAALHPPLALALADGGTFPPRRPARVAWVGVVAGPGLGALQADVERAAVAAGGIAPEDRPYHPHVTLARCSDAWPRAAIDTFTTAFAGPVGEPFTAAEVLLIESQLGRGGARYRTAAQFPLGGSR
jgi:RNA 2',3'-cyclic 3'-phosphodiesterase